MWNRFLYLRASFQNTTNKPLTKEEFNLLNQILIGFYSGPSLPSASIRLLEIYKNHRVIRKKKTDPDIFIWSIADIKMSYFIRIKETEKKKKDLPLLLGWSSESNSTSCFDRHYIYFSTCSLYRDNIWMAISKYRTTETNS